MSPVKPPPIRRIALDREPHVATPPTGDPNGATTATAAPSTSARLRAERPAVGSVRERMRV
ncbi:MAG TPA: hypothetical protein VL972_04810, partial [Solirubrobacteraceae bacterium]|nr:hypothetical protein [Solirubrobacteraceae bacterium]